MKQLIFLIFISIIFHMGAQESKDIPTDVKKLHQASKKGRITKIITLLDRNIDVNAKGQSGITAMSYASAQGHMKIVEILLKNGADVKLIDEMGMTSLHWACIGGHNKIVALLLFHGININIKNKCKIY